MARYFLDTEFHEHPYTIGLISIGIVCDDGREFYAQNATLDLSVVNEWVRQNVLPGLTPYGNPEWMKANEIRHKLLEFFGIPTATIPVPEIIDPDPEIWGWYADYDWVIFCWTIAGPMVNLPQKFPRYCRDLKQFNDDLGLSKEEIALPPSPEDEHNALADARWNKLVYDRLVEVAQAHRYDV